MLHWLLFALKAASPTSDCHLSETHCCALPFCMKVTWRTWWNGHAQRLRKCRRGWFRSTG